MSTVRQRSGVRGFTLVEVLVVIAVIAILSSVLATNFSDARALARDEVRAADLDQIKLALALYRAENGAYPSGSGAICTDADQCSSGELSSGPSTALAPYLEGVADPRAGDSGFGYYYHGSRNCDATYAAVTVHARTAETARYQNVSDARAEFCSDLGTAGGGLEPGGDGFIVFINFTE